MIKHLLKHIWTQRAVNAWLWVELLVVSVCLSYISDYLYTTATVYFSPLGFDTEHVYRVELSKVDSGSEAYVAGETDSLRTASLLSIINRIRAYPGVEAVVPVKHSYPYSPGSSSDSRGVDTTWVHGHVYNVSPEYFRVFRITDKNGQVEPLVAAAQAGTLIVSAKGEEEYAKEGISIQGHGIKYWGQEEAKTVVSAVCADVRFDEFARDYPVYYDYKPEIDYMKDMGNDARFCIRVRPEADVQGFLPEFRKTMKAQLRVGNYYLVDVISFEDIRTNYFRANGNINTVKTHVAGLSFLLLNILLGVIGTFWIRTQQRRSEIGLRLALGSSRNGIRKELLIEGMLLLIIAFIPAAVISGNIGHFLFNDNPQEPFTAGRFLIGQSVTFVLMAIMIIAGILFPARQAMNIEPAEALHAE